jgi:hypothetical protein
MTKQEIRVPYCKSSLMALAFLFVFSTNSKSQQNPNAVVFTAGAGASFVQVADPFNTSGTYFSAGNFSRWSYPAYILNCDFRTSDRLSLGACLSWQSLGFNFTNVPYPNTQSNNYYNNPSPQESWGDSYNRYNIAARVLYYFVREQNLDAYFGARAGYTWWDRSTTNSDPSYNFSIYDEYSKIFLTPVGLQAIFGMRYFFSQNFGITAEGGIGPPYALLLGLNVRFSN